MDAMTPQEAGRRAVLQAAAGALALLALPPARARMPLLTGAEQDAVALEFTPDAARLHASLQPLYVAGSRCAQCAFYQGRRSDETAACTVFAGWRVPAAGWCREFVAKRR
jgi:hypothetical protein